MSKLDYDGTPELNRRRTLSEQESSSILQDNKQDRQLDADTTKQETTQIFVDLAKTYLKGQALKNGIRKMDQGGYIPVEDGADTVAAACMRLDKAGTINGTIIPYNLYTRCVDSLIEAQWNMRLFYYDVSMPSSVETRVTKTFEVYKKRGKTSEAISDFMNGNGVAGALLMAFCVAPFQNIIFQALGLEEGAKVAASAQVPIGIAVLLELGLKAKSIIDLLKKSNMNTPVIEDLANEMALNPDKRREAFTQAGIDYDSLIANRGIDDNNIIISYVSEYIRDNTAALATSVSYDHWIAYSAVSAHQTAIRAALDTADNYSIEFANMSERNEKNVDAPSNGVVSDSIASDPISPIHNEVGSHYKILSRATSSMYDDILQSLMYQVTDADLCCLVEIFGAFDTEVLRLIANILRIVAVDLAGEMLRVQNAFKKFISNLIGASIYELIAQLNRFYDKIAAKLLKALNIDLGYEHCVSLKSVAMSVLMGLEAIDRRIQNLLIDMLGLLQDFGRPSEGIWSVSADRRHLITIAKILDVLADKVDAAKICRKSQDKTPAYVIEDVKDQAAQEIMHTLIDKSPPTVQLTNEEIIKYFPDLQNKKSKRFGFEYGVAKIAGDIEKERQVGHCSDLNSPEQVETFKNRLEESLATQFSNGSN